jgi:phage shock protein A
MGLIKRVSQVFQQKSNALLNKVEDPTQALDLSYQKMLENLQQVRKSIADVLTSQKRLEAQRAQLNAQYEKLQGQARQALQQGQEDVARMALERATSIKGQIDALTPQIQQLASQEASLEETGRKLNAKIEAFRAQKDSMKAQYTAAKASSQALENLTGLSDQMTDVNLMMDRAKDKIAEMQSRASAVGELADSGVLDSPELGGSGDDIEAMLSKGSGTSDVDLQLQAMKAELAAGSAPSQSLPAGSTPQPAATNAPSDAGQQVDGPEASKGSEPATKDPNPAASPGTPSQGTITVRILGEGRYAIPDTLEPALDGIDQALEKAVAQGDESSFKLLISQLTELIKANGKQLDDTAAGTDLVVPAPDTTLSEAKKLFLIEEDQGS